MLNSKFATSIAPGPIEVAKNLGEIIDEGFSVWVSPTILTRLKKEFKLVPGSKSGYRKWLIASPPVSLEKEELLTHVPKSKIEPETNTMRVIWDLSFGDFRLQEARLNILRRFLNEI